MNIIFGTVDDVNQLDSKYTTLELDTLRLPGSDVPVTAWCVLENLQLMDVVNASQLRSIHQDLMHNYRSKNWNYCEQALEHLVGNWGGQLDSFYDELSMRIKNLRQQDLDDSWTGVIDRT